MGYKYGKHPSSKVTATVGTDSKVKLLIIADRLNVSSSEVLNHLIEQVTLEDWEEVKSSLDIALANGLTVKQYIATRVKQ